MKLIRESGTWPVVYGAVVLLVLGLFLFSVRPVLTPLLLFLVLLLLLTPYVGTRQYVLTVTATALLLGVWLLRTTGFLLAPFILALVLAYILDPAVDFLERRRVPRPLGVVLLALPVVALFLVALIFGIPALADQVEALIREAPVLVERLERWAERAQRWVLGLNLPLVREEVLLERLRAPAADDVVAFLEAQQEEIARRSWQAVLGLGRGIGTLLTVLGYVVLTPVLTYYLLQDYDRITARVAELIPEGRRKRWLGFIEEYDRLLSRYLRGQVIAAAVVGLLTGLGLWIARFPFAGLVGAVAGVFNLVPYLGLVVSLIPALVIALLSGNVLVSLLKVAVVFTLVQILDSSVLGPRIVGGSVGLHPVWVMLALTLGGFFFGFVGLLLAVPVAVLLKLLSRIALERYRTSAVFRGTAAEGEG